MAAIPDLTAKNMGWLRRPELGPNVWELPCGCLYAHFNGGEPRFQVIGYPAPSFHTDTSRHAKKGTDNGLQPPQ